MIGPSSALPVKSVAQFSAAVAGFAFGKPPSTLREFVKF
jgi:hypothetical protein